MSPPGNNPRLSLDTARFLLDLLNAQALQIGAPDFEPTLQRILDARRELTAIIDSANAK